ncbi:MAG: glycosyltransferase [Synechococcus sp.]|nr:glycosyltransferase [Synechococcus sp.]
MRIGLYCPAETGHLNTMLPIGEALLQRGHQVIFIGLEDAKDKVEAIEGIDFFPVATEKFPQGSTPAIFKTLGELKGMSALIYTVKTFRDIAEAILQDGAESCKSLHLDGMVVDQSTSEGVAIAKYLDLPYVTVCSALPFDTEAATPPVFTTWTYQNTLLGKLRNILVHKLIAAPFGAIVQAPIKKFLKKYKIAIPKSFNSPLAIICQQPKSFEFPRRNLPQNFYFTGPYHTTTSRKQIDFPWDQLNVKPLIYASMGTLQNRLGDVFQKIAAACASLDVQLVISLGGSANPEDIPRLPGNPLVVSYAPQIELLKQAQLTITHAGMNTTLESLTQGVPMVAIPVTNDQPGIAARIKWSGVGEFITLDQLTTEKLHQTIKTVLNDSTYQERAKQSQQEICRSGGTSQAVDIIEMAIATRAMVIAPS